MNKSKICQLFFAEAYGWQTAPSQVCQQACCHHHALYSRDANCAWCALALASPGQAHANSQGVRQLLTRVPSLLLSACLACVPSLTLSAFLTCIKSCSCVSLKLVIAPPELVGLGRQGSGNNADTQTNGTSHHGNGELRRWRCNRRKASIVQ